MSAPALYLIAGFNLIR